MRQKLRGDILGQQPVAFFSAVAKVPSKKINKVFFIAFLRDRVLKDFFIVNQDQAVGVFCRM